MKRVDRGNVPLWRNIALALSAAVLMSLALPNEVFSFGFVPLGFVALVPLYVLLVDTADYRTSALLTGIFGAVQHAFSSYWLWFFKDFRVWTLGSTTIAYGVIYAVLGLYLALLIRRTGRARPLAFALLWTAFEYLKSTGFLGYPWGLLPYSLTTCLPLLQIADITGVYGISFVLALANAAIAEVVLTARKQVGQRRELQPSLGYVGIALALTAGLALYGVFRMGRPIPEIGRFKALLVQQNADPWEVGEEKTLSENIKLAKSALVEAGEVPDIILFSETTLQRPYEDFRTFYTKKPRNDPLIPFIKETGTWLFTGAPIILDWDSLAGTNSVILIAPDARQVASYAKVHPVPFAEAIPFWDYAPFRLFIQKVVGLESGWVMGTKFTIFELPTERGTYRFGAPICFEDAFAGVCREYFKGGADLLLNLTNDSWSKTRSSEIQHWAAARFRAIEYRRTLVRSTNGGLSCVVGPYGEVRAELPLFEACSRIVEVPVCRDSKPTAYYLYGDWFALLSLLLSGGWAFILMVRRGRP